jgi:DNA polymerase
MVTLYPLFHPAAALRSTSVLELLRADVHRLPELIAEHIPEPAPDEEQLGFFG